MNRHKKALMSMKMRWEVKSIDEIYFHLWVIIWKYLRSRKERWQPITNLGFRWLTCAVGWGFPPVKGVAALVTLDLWEHAYYLDHQNDRGSFVEGLWDLIDWERANQLFLDNLSGSKKELWARFVRRARTHALRWTLSTAGNTKTLRDASDSCGKRSPQCALLEAHARAMRWNSAGQQIWKLWETHNQLLLARMRALTPCALSDARALCAEIQQGRKDENSGKRVISYYLACAKQR